MPDIKFPWPINVKSGGTINGTSFRIHGAGVIRTYGVYDAILNFDTMPAHFHPSSIGAFVVSNSCGAGASMRNGGINMSAMGVEEYEVHRVLTLGGGELHLQGQARYTPEALELDIEIEGEAEIPDDVICHSVYSKKVFADGPGTLVGTGEGSLFRADGSDIPVGINTNYKISPNPLPNPLTNAEYRTATESGVLFGTSYHLRIHSIFDGQNTMAMLDG
ncbi:hypothetical protein QWI29_17910 [Mycolicibacterium neoaurum]|uniref:hypothetical protein n=1 Tax=Mycolicibacterium neoaurum TaxID=1795 RepID=UPI0026732720|nr:hypothetical protein [Mycolicibacterium neoaurum]MDO3401920.1 hypothetical protein [Mycolicibacterium neoaurum]